MRYTRFIVAILALLSTTACFVDDTVQPIVPGERSDVITVIGRVTRFADCDVSTRGVKDAEEARISNMAMAIFPCNDNGITGPCLYYNFERNEAELLFTVDRASLNPVADARYAMYVFTNVDFEAAGITESSTLDDMINVATDVSNLRIPEGGFPMIGSLGDTFSTKINRDGKKFVLAPSNSDNDLPTVDGKEENLLTIPMKALFAKINFTIEVEPDQTIAGNYTPQFNATSFVVKNVPSEVDFDNSSNDAEVLADVFTVSAQGNTVASGANTVSYTFYLPERRFTPDFNYETCDDFPFEKGSYSKQIDNDQNGYRDEDEKYFQRFKGKLLGEDQKATHVVITGRYRDHQNHYWDVNYTIYLGEDNSKNFDINRNYEYNNYVTIRGIQNSSDMSDNGNAISIDHRVNVKRSQPGIVSLRREVLLDSHFEVRPLRIRANDGVVENSITHVMVEIDNPNTTKWMRLERSFGVGSDGEGKDIYITSGVSAGKRKYFTFDLITGDGTANLGDLAPLTNNTKVIVPLTAQDECVWIYVDECTETGDGVRAGKINVSYGTIDSSGEFKANELVDEQDKALYPSISYIIHQRMLFPVQYENRTYHIEYEEEYLHNFDADDEYGSTDAEGMPWGLPNTQLSYDFPAIYLDGDGNNILDDWNGATVQTIIDLVNEKLPIDPKYDFYLPRDTESEHLTTRGFAGYDFCKEIIQVVNGQGNHDTGDSNNIDVLQLDQKPKSAIEYCYNKNKRNCNGQVAWTGNTANLKWYLPAIDEIEAVMKSKYGDNLPQNTYSRFIDFQDKYYWSSQPAYIPYSVHMVRYNWIFLLGWADHSTTDGKYDGLYYIDDKDRARATKVSTTDGLFNGVISSGADEYQGYQNAIFYLSNGVFGSDKNINKTINLGNITTINEDYVGNHYGNKSRSDYARVRCVRKMQ